MSEIEQQRETCLCHIFYESIAFLLNLHCVQPRQRLGDTKPQAQSQDTPLFIHLHNILDIVSPWAKSEKVTVWSHEREQRFDTSNLFFNL